MARTKFLGSLSWFVALALGCANGSTTTHDAAVDAGLSCIACSVWQVRCGDTCVDLTASPDNCGGCGVHCDTRSQVCTGGVCMTVPTRCTPLGGTDSGVSDAVSEPEDGSTLATDAAEPSDVATVTDGSVTDVPLVSMDGGYLGLTGLRGEYYNSTSLIDLVMVRTDPVVDFDWSMVSPDPSVPLTNFSARWTGTVTPVGTGAFTFVTVSDDGVRLWVNNQLIIDDWTMHGATEDDGTITLTSGQSYDIRLEYFQGTGGAQIHLSWQASGLHREIIPTTQLTPGTGTDYTCATGACCPAGGSLPVCCPAGTTCVVNANFSGCCPAGEACGVAPTCGGDLR